MKCQMCGEINKLDVRYCESCGARLEAPVVAAVHNAAPAVAALTCTQCNAIILPGERVCEQCGTSVPQGNAESTGVSGELRVSDLPSGGFADTTLDMNSFHAPTPSNMSGPLQYTIETDATESDSAPGDLAQTHSEDPVAEADVASPVDASSGEVTSQHGSGVGIAASIEADYEVADIVETPAPSAAEIQALKQQRASLELEIKRQEDIIHQLDAMRTTFREVTPQAVLMGISEAEQKLVGLKSELDSLPRPPEIDPLLIERLKKDMARQVEIIEQFEQIQRTFGSATPRAVLVGITDARASLGQINADLIAYGVESALPKVNNPDVVPVPPVVTPAPVAPRVVAAPAEPIAPSPLQAAPIVSAPLHDLPVSPEAPVVPADVLAAATNSGPLAPITASDVPTIAERPVGQVVNPVAPTARLQLESGTVLTLPSGRREIIIGRDDPISGVHPEVDMTPYGAESGGVSRRHVRLTVLEGQWMITDLQSTNHTRVNGVRIDPGVPTQLPDGAQVVLGRIGFIFRCS